MYYSNLAALSVLKTSRQSGRITEQQIHIYNETRRDDKADYKTGLTTNRDE